MDPRNRVDVIQGESGRLEAAPDGELFVRNPAAARAKAIRDKVALYKQNGMEVPEHLQKQFDSLPKDDGCEIELVTEHGDHVAEVDVIKGEPTPVDMGSNSNLLPEGVKPEVRAPAPEHAPPPAEPEPEPEPVAAVVPEPEPEPTPEPEHTMVLSATAVAVVPEPAPEPPAPPVAPARPGQQRPRGRPRK